MNRLIAALDTDDLKVARQLIDSLAPIVRIFKVGSQLFTGWGPDVLQFIRKKGAEVFLDLKFHDIPNTVKGAVKAACRYNPLMLSVHTLGGSQMLRQAIEARDHSGVKTKILGVTILTSLDRGQLEEIGLSVSLNEEVLALARIAKRAGLDGVICSPREIGIIRQNIGQDFIVVTPGIRPSGPMNDDQRRTTRAKEAVLAGADYLVVGRPILQAQDPYEVARKIIEDIGNGYT